MTKDGNFKRLVRARAARTGESYQAARHALRPSGRPTGGVEDEIRAVFARDGIVRLTGVFSHDDAEAMREAVWAGWSHAYGVRRDDPATWSAVPPWKTLRTAKRDPSFQAVIGTRLAAAADLLIGPGWSVPNGLGNLLASPPDAPTWHLPGRDGLWHSDFGYTTTMSPLAALRVFAVFGDVPPQGGGTLLVAGSHRMVERFVEAHPNDARRRAKEARAACQRSNEWLAELTSGDGRDPGRVERFMRQESDVDGISARVIEACGEPGDVYVCHPWTIHCRPPNASDRPRFLRSPTLSHRRMPSD